MQQGEDLWPQVQDALQATLSKPTFETWIRPARCRAISLDRLELEAPNSFACTWLRKHYLSQIQDLACDLAKRPVKVTVDVAAATTEERAAAFDGFFSYAGRWRIVAGRVEHRVTVSLNPGLVGTRQWRDAELTGRRLVLSVDEGEGAAARRHELEWRRAGPRVRP